jgi:hypothetical protein
MENMTKANNLMFDVYVDTLNGPISLAMQAVSVEQVTGENDNRFGQSDLICVLFYLDFV